MPKGSQISRRLSAPFVPKANTSSWAPGQQRTVALDVIWRLHGGLAPDSASSPIGRPSARLAVVATDNGRRTRAAGIAGHVEKG
jgi:hypothetical protein